MMSRNRSLHDNADALHTVNLKENMLGDEKKVNDWVVRLAKARTHSSAFSRTSDRPSRTQTTQPEMKGNYFCNV